MVERIAHSLGGDDFRTRKGQSLLDVPDNVRVDAVSFSRKQLATGAREHERPENLEAIDSAGEVRRLPFHGAVQCFEAPHRRCTDVGNLRVDIAQAEIRAETDAPGCSSATHAGLEAVGWGRTRKRIMHAQRRHGILHQGDVGHATRHWAFHPKTVEGRQAVAPGYNAGAWPETDDATETCWNAQRSPEAGAVCEPHFVCGQGGRGAPG